MILKLGEILVKNNVLTLAQVDAILDEQATRHQPFGALAEELFAVAPEDVEHAWAEQYEMLAEHIDPRRCIIPDEVLGMVSRRQAWQFRVVPLEIDHGHLVLATTREHLPRAVRFASRVLTLPCTFVIAEAHALGETLVERYPLGGFTAECVHTLPGVHDTRATVS
ncbi:MAG: hypothetical protein AAGB34_00855 [Planctomycetota bacterium]